SSVTVRSAVIWLSLKFAVLPAPSATMPRNQLGVSLQSPSASTIQFPSNAFTEHGVAITIIAPTVAITFRNRFFILGVGSLLFCGFSGVKEKMFRPPAYQ